jgi:hypothetical protein
MDARVPRGRVPPVGVGEVRQGRQLRPAGAVPAVGDQTVAAAADHGEKTDADVADLNGRVVAGVVTPALAVRKAVLVGQRPGARDLRPGTRIRRLPRRVVVDDHPVLRACEQRRRDRSVGGSDLDRPVVLRFVPALRVGQDRRHQHLRPLPEPRVEPEHLDPSGSARDELVDAVTVEVDGEDVLVVRRVAPAVEVGEPWDEVRRPDGTVVVECLVGVRAGGSRSPRRRAATQEEERRHGEHER